MSEAADHLSGVLVTAGVDLDREFEARLADSSALAFRVAYSVVRHRQDAEDVAQEAFARAYRKFSQLRDRDRFRAWLVRMTWRLAIDFKRRNRRQPSGDESVMDQAGPTDLERQALSAERSERLWRAIDTLSEKLRLTVVLVSIEEQSIRDVAVMLGVPEGTIKSRLFDARQKLKELLG